MYALAENAARERGYPIESGKCYGWAITRKELIALYKAQGFPTMADGAPAGMDAHIRAWVESNDVVRIGNIQGLMPNGTVPRFAPIDSQQRGGILFFRPTAAEYRAWEAELRRETARTMFETDAPQSNELWDQVPYIVIKPRDQIADRPLEPEFHALNGRAERVKTDANQGVFASVYR